MKTIDNIGVKVGTDNNKEVLRKLAKYYKQRITSKEERWAFDGVSDGVLLVQINSKQKRFFTYSMEFGFFDTDVTGEVWKRGYWK